MSYQSVQVVQDKQFLFLTFKFQYNEKKVFITVGIFFQIVNPNFMYAQQLIPSNDSTDFVLRLMNERKAVNSMYEILYSFEELVTNWNTCIYSADPVTKCEKNFAHYLYVIETLVRNYIALTKNPMPDTKKGKDMYMSLSLPGNRLPSTQEAHQILKECETLITLIDADIKSNN